MTIHDTPQQLRTIYATLAEYGVYGREADNVLQAVTPGARYLRPMDVVDEAAEQLDIDPATTFTSLAEQLTKARRNMGETEYNAAVVRYFGPEGAVFALLAPAIYDALEEEDPDVFRKPQGEGWVRLGFSNPRTGSVERTGTDENGNWVHEIRTRRK